MDETFKKANLIIKTFVEGQHTKLANGQRLRKEMHESIANGGGGGYRARWIIDVVGSIFTLVGEKASEFNAKHQDDAISVEDVLDVLETAIAKVKSS